MSRRNESSFSRDELKQHGMRISGFDHPGLRYFISDVRGPERLHRAFNGMDHVRGRR